MLISSLPFCFAVQSAHAGGEISGRVTFVRVHDYGVTIVGFDAPAVGTPPPCGRQYRKQLAFDSKTEAGKSLLSLFISAKLSGAQVTASGSGECSKVITDVETLITGELTGQY